MKRERNIHFRSFFVGNLLIAIKNLRKDLFCLINFEKLKTIINKSPLIEINLMWKNILITSFVHIFLYDSLPIVKSKILNLLCIAHLINSSCNILPGEYLPHSPDSYVGKIK